MFRQQQIICKRRVIFGYRSNIEVKFISGLPLKQHLKIPGHVPDFSHTFLGSVSVKHVIQLVYYTVICISDIILPVKIKLPDFGQILNFPDFTDCWQPCYMNIHGNTFVLIISVYY